MATRSSGDAKARRRPSPAVVRRRRLVALLAAALVMAAVIWIAVVASQGGKGGESPAAEPSVTPTETGPRAVTADDLAPTGAPSGSETPTDSATPAPAPAGPCTAPDVRVTANLDAESYAPGVLPKLSLTLENAGAAPCIVDLGTAKIVYTITSDSDQIWISTDCQQDPQSQLVELAAGQRIDAQPVEWVRERSTKESCAGERPAALGGGASYALTASVDGIASEPRGFILD